VLSYDHGVSQVPLLGETLGENLSNTIARFPEREALVSRHQQLRLTYAQLGEQVDALASGLLALGLQKGDRVGLWAPNCVEWVLVQFATARLGAVLVNINPAYRTHELEYVLQQSGARLLISAPQHKGSDYRAMVAQVRAAVPSLERAVFLGDDDWHQLAGSAVDREAVRAREASLSCDDPINLQYTSGTTGFPKGATLSHHNILNNGFFIGELLHYGPDDRLCIPVPYYHCFGMVIGNLAATTHGACMVIPAASFDPEATLAAVHAERCTSLLGVPTMFIAQLAHPKFAGFDLSSLRTGVMAGAPCPIELMRKVVSLMHMREVAICYGMTETSPVSTQTRVDDPLEVRVASVGRALPHVEVKIVDPLTGLTVPRGQPGEFCTRGYSVMLGYWNEPQKTAEAIDAAGWMHTGDLATMDAQGSCNIVGRIKDMLIRGGENIYPREIEEFLHGHPHIVDVQVVGVPDPKYGEEICAWVRLRDGAALEPEALRAFCRGALAHFKVPRYVLVVDEFPMTVTGKVQKYKLREEAVRRLALALD
jgi:fatty-acyl-CoA synthase